MCRFFAFSITINIGDDCGGSGNGNVPPNNGVVTLPYNGAGGYGSPPDPKLKDIPELVNYECWKKLTRQDQEEIKIS